MARQTYRVDRTHPTRSIYKNSRIHERAVRQLIAWCATDNLGWSHHDAAHAADAAPLDGTVFHLGDYTFKITPEHV